MINSDVVADTFRALNVVLAMLYMPLLYLRIKEGNREKITFLIGVFGMLIALIIGTYNRRHSGFTSSLPLWTLSLLTMIASSARNQKRDRRRARRHHNLLNTRRR